MPVVADAPLVRPQQYRGGPHRTHQEQGARTGGPNFRGSTQHDLSTPVTKVFLAKVDQTALCSICRPGARDPSPVHDLPFSKTVPLFLVAPRESIRKVGIRRLPAT